MVTKKRATKAKKATTKKSSRSKKKVSYIKADKTQKQFPLRERTDVAWKNFLAFSVLFVFSFILYSFSVSDLFINFFGIMSVIFGFLAFALLIAFVVLAILRASSKRKAEKAKGRK